MLKFMGFGELLERLGFRVGSLRVQHPVPDSLVEFSGS